MTILQTALCNLKDEVMLTNYFNRFYDVAEQLVRGDQKYPQVYTGNGQYQNIFDLDVNGTGYFRKTGSVRFGLVSSSNSVTSCPDSNPLIDISFPMRCVAIVPKKKLSDNSYSDDMLAFELIATIGRRQTAIANVQSVSGYVDSYKTDRDEIWHEEVKNIPRQLDLTLSVIAIDFNLNMRASLDCLPQNCDY